LWEQGTDLRYIKAILGNTFTKTKAALDVFQLPLGAELLEGDLRGYGKRHPVGPGDESGELDESVPFVHFRGAPEEP
jgi:hypothetical protein